jgi:hypothetical protein
MAKTEIKSEISLNTTKFQRGLAKSQKGINNFASNAISKFGAIAGVAGLGMLARSAIDLGSKISDMAVQMNIGTDELQTLEFAAREAGVGVDVMARALRNSQLRTEEAINGNKSYGDAFVRLGINIQDFKKLSVEKKMEAIAIAQSKATDKAAAYNAVSRILGEKAGPALQEVLQKLAGPQGYGGLEAAAKRAGEIMSKETIAKMDAAADSIESFKRKMTVMAAGAMSFVQGSMEKLGTTLGMLYVSVETGKNAWAEYDESIDGILAAYDPLTDKTVMAERAQHAMAMATDMSTQFFYDQIEAIDTLEQRLDEQAKKELDLSNKKFIAAKKLEELRLRAAGKTAEADAMAKQIKLTEESLKISKQHEISLAEAAKIVQGIEKNKPTEAADAINASKGTGSAGGSSSTRSFDAADANKSGTVTGREQRAKESADRKAATEARRARTLEVAREAGAGERARDASRNQRFDAREASAGLNLAGNDPTASRKPLEEEAKKQTEELESISKTLAKLDSALGE